MANAIPFPALRMAVYRQLGVRIGAGSIIMRATELQSSSEMVIGNHTVINPHCWLDGRGGLVIGSNVNISSHVILVAGTHDLQDGASFDGMIKPITIEDHVWLCTRCTVLPGVTVGRGAVVAAGAVVTRSVTPHTIVAGVPARKIGERSPELHYTLAYNAPWQ